MHILDCLSPKRIFNKYLEEFVDVPCGKCPACLKSRANRWIERLNVERKCWKYCVFFTLTYAPENVPYLRKLDHGFYGDLSHKHQADGIDCPLFSLSDVYRNLDKDSVLKCQRFLSTFEQIPYLSVYDCQLFIKRLRKNLKNAVSKRFESSSPEDYQVRYYVIGEYGSTTFRSHYHGLFFFSSDKEASCIEECISKSWTLGIVDSSFVAESNAGYLAKYLNCTVDLPKVLTYCKQTRPFAIFSKSSPIGSLYFNEEKIREIFDSASPYVLVDYLKSLSPQYVPLWRLYKDRLFPKLALFSKFSHFDRVRLYRTFEYFEQNFPQVADSSASFARYMLDRYTRLQTNSCFGVYSSGFLKLYQDYLDELFKSFDNDCQRYNSLVRWYRCSSRVVHQARVFGLSVESYVSQIEKFYSNCDYQKLVSQYQFMQDYAESFGSSSLIGIDKGFLESVLDVPLELLSFEEITILESFGIDLEKFTSDNLSERLEYQSLILPENTRDFWNFMTDSLSWLKKATKTKKKNDYLMAHPELQNLL